MRPGRIIVTLACGECKRRNYTTTRARKETERLALHKFCKFCRRHTLHKEVK